MRWIRTHEGIFHRLFLTYMLILAVVIGTLAIAISQFLKIYFFQAKQKELLNVGRQVETQVIRYQRRDTALKELSTAINTIGRATNSRIIVVEKSTPDKLSNDIKIDSELQALLQKVWSGNTVINRRQFARELNTYVVMVGIPVTGGENKTAILLFSPVYEVDQALKTTYRIIWLTSLLSAAVGFAAIWVTSRKISNPIVDLSKSAEQIAGGSHVSDVKAETGGEIGLLVNSFNSMKNQIARTEQMRKEFIAGVSHELRTPLTSIRGYIQGILDGIILPDQQSKYLELAFGEINRMVRMTNDLLELTKIEAGVVRLYKQKTGLKALIEDSMLAARESFAKKIINVTVEVNPGDLQLNADPDRLKQVLINLLTNAYKYTPQEGHITVNAMQKSDQIVIRVQDTGVGIPNSELPLIFEKFHRVDKSRDSSEGGTGLGLSIAKNIVELHGGRITADSVEGAGTCFEIIFPE